MRLFLPLTLATVLLGQPAPLSEKWAGSWALDTEKSNLRAMLPPGATVLSQTLKIELTASQIHLSGDTVLAPGALNAHDDNTLALDGKETRVGPISLSFRRIDGATFEIVSKGEIGGRAMVEVSRYVLSPDEQTISATKTRTAGEQEISKTVLVYNPR